MMFGYSEKLLKRFIRSFKILEKIEEVKFVLHYRHRPHSHWKFTMFLVPYATNPSRVFDCAILDFDHDICLNSYEEQLVNILETREHVLLGNKVHLFKSCGIVMESKKPCECRYSNSVWTLNYLACFLLEVGGKFRGRNSLRRRDCRDPCLI